MLKSLTIRSLALVQGTFIMIFIKTLNPSMRLAITVLLTKRRTSVESLMLKKDLNSLIRKFMKSTLKATTVFYS